MRKKQILFLLLSAFLLISVAATHLVQENLVKDLSVKLDEGATTITFSPAKSLLIRERLRAAGVFNEQYPEKPLTIEERNYLAGD